MYDFWYTIGRAVMDRSLLTALQNANPAPLFSRINRTILETDATGKVTFSYTNTDTAGLLTKANTESVRDEIWDWMVANPVVSGNANPPLPPPISIYTAGRFCQFLTVDQFDWVKRIETLNDAYNAALAPAQPKDLSERFPAFLGVCLIDEDLTAKVSIPDDAGFRKAATQFGITVGSTEWGVIDRLMTEPPEGQSKPFLDVQEEMMADPNGDWAELCGNQRDFWEPQNERAIV
jgi:hypothetical protein